MKFLYSLFTYSKDINYPKVSIIKLKNILLLLLVVIAKKFLFEIKNVGSMFANRPYRQGFSCQTLTMD